MRIYTYNENTTRAGQVVFGEIDDEDFDTNSRGGYDYALYAEGSEEEIAKIARERLAARHDRRPGGAGDAHAHREAMNVIDYLG